jgi:hypothetical protein
MTHSLAPEEKERRSSDTGKYRRTGRYDFKACCHQKYTHEKNALHEPFQKDNHVCSPLCNFSISEPPPRIEHVGAFAAGSVSLTFEQFDFALLDRHETFQKGTWFEALQRLEGWDHVCFQEADRPLKLEADPLPSHTH